MSRLRHPWAVARGLGSAKEGVAHWWAQRVSAAALLFLVPWFVITAVSLIGLDHANARAFLAEPMNATLMLAFVLAVTWHARLGLQVVIEDYIHTPWLEVALQLAVKFAYALAALASVVAIGRIAFTA
ncbi:succinate dehydrogenase, hydrophobic membrane anchor protein [Silanimonas sp.]|jgi:succinate dehydrogenase / fumarate reductase membrane anchor subunit|uniref:succinate dehydrogenase, hydrophobic membrane anchor protein n=1 Tax=Silanimonas sp. TaxID=1929290 RepID=UPI0022C56A7F|nr:succinate dehydrogenase, hydrophobic membrane anchor protein [Silanimonas sp.]MCZ8113448.1 succinate dehydrogenase, hydrophobic membrane anchor protein [Silanimonas sp.]